MFSRKYQVSIPVELYSRSTIEPPDGILFDTSNLKEADAVSDQVITTDGSFKCADTTGFSA